MPPPDELDPEAQREWRVHMHLCVTAGTINSTNLRSFVSLAQSAAAAQVAYRLAIRIGPLVRTKDSAKVSPAWKAYLETDAIYQRWARQFGLTPQSAKGLPQLPTLGGPLRAVE